MTPKPVGSLICHLNVTLRLRNIAEIRVSSYYRVGLKRGMFHAAADLEPTESFRLDYVCVLFAHA